MALLRKCNIPKPSVLKETVEVPELEGSVVIRGTMLDERLALIFSAKETSEKEGGEAPVTEDDPRERYAHIARLLAYAVVDVDGEPIYTVDEWLEFGGQHYAATLRLYGIAKRLSGMDLEAAKKNS